MKDGSQLAIKLQELGIKKKRLAELLGVHANTITLWLNKQKISPRTRAKIAKALNATEQEVFSSEYNLRQDNDLHILKEPKAVYGGVASVSGLKKLDALQYCGLLSNAEDAIALQREWRAEW